MMFIVYYISVTTVGTWATDWANDGVFGDGWHLVGNEQYAAVAEEFDGAASVVDGFVSYEEAQGAELGDLPALIDRESDTYDPAAAKAALQEFASGIADTDEAVYEVTDEETLATEEVTSTGAELKEALTVLDSYGYEAPDPASYGVWVPGIPVLVEQALQSANCAPWLYGLIMDGIIAGVGPYWGLYRRCWYSLSSWRFWNPAGIWPELRLLWTVFSVIRSVGEIVYPDSHWHRVRCARHYGLPYH